MNPSLPNEDLVFCLKFPILNLTQRLLEGQYVIEGFPQHGLHAVHVVYVARSVGGSYIFLGNRYPLTGRNSRPIPAKRVNTFKYMRSTLSEEGKLDAEVTHRVQNG